MNTRQNPDSLLARISDGISADAANLQRFELARLGRVREAARQFQGLLNGLKQQVERKAALRAQASFAAGRLELRSATA